MNEIKAFTESVIQGYAAAYSFPGWSWSCTMSFGRQGVTVLVSVNKDGEITLTDGTSGECLLTWDEIESPTAEPHMTIWYKVRPVVERISEVVRAEYETALRS